MGGEHDFLDLEVTSGAVLARIMHRLSPALPARIRPDGVALLRAPRRTARVHLCSQNCYETSALANRAATVKERRKVQNFSLNQPC